MLLFIALPILSVLLQSVHTPHEAVLITSESCGPFGCSENTTIDHDATRKLKSTEPMGRFVGLNIYFDRAHLAVDQVSDAWRTTDNFSTFFGFINSCTIAIPNKTTMAPTGSYQCNFSFSRITPAKVDTTGIE